MIVVLEYTEKDFDAIERILADKLNDGWSCRYDDVVVAEVMVTDTEASELVKAGVKVNAHLPHVEWLVLHTIMTDFAHDGISAVVRNGETINVKKQEDEVLGQIVVKDDATVYFVHGDKKTPVAWKDEAFAKLLSDFLKSL